jgi:hypothetical protein
MGYEAVGPKSKRGCYSRQSRGQHPRVANSYAASATAAELRR